MLWFRELACVCFLSEHLVYYLNTLQVMSEGGPQPQSSIHFSITNSSVAEVNQLGQVTARTVGTTTIQGAIRVVSEDTGGVTVFSQVSFHYIPQSFFLSLFLRKTGNGFSGVLITLVALIWKI